MAVLIMGILLHLSAYALCDILFNSFVACPLLRFYPFGILSYIWFLTSLKFPLLLGIAWRFSGKWWHTRDDFRSRALSLCLVVLSFTPAVYGTARLLIFWAPVEVHSGWLLSLPAALASGIACWIWGLLLTCGSQVGPLQDGQREKRGLKTWVAIGRLWRYSKDDMAYLAGAFLFLTFAVVGEMFIPYYIGRVIDILGSKYREADFHAAIFFMAVFSVASSFSAGCRGGLFMFTLARLTRRLRLLLFKAVVSQEISFFDSAKTGEITSRLSTDTASMSRSIAANVNIFLRSVVKAIATYVFMLNISWQLTLITSLDLLITALVQTGYNHFSEDLVKRVQDSMARSNALAGEVVSAIRTVRSFAMEDEEVERYRAALLETHRLKTRRERVQTLYSLVRKNLTQMVVAVHQLMELATHVAMLYIGQHLVKTGSMSSGRLVSFILYQMEAGSHVRTMVHMYSQMILSVGAAEKVFHYMDRIPEVSTDGRLKPDTLQGHVQFKNVTFSYPTRENVLQNVSFELKTGKVTALVGPSGGGKTTCVSLLQRFYKHQDGEILLDGCPIHQYEHKYLHSKISLVGQEPILFTCSIKENIVYGLKNVPMEDVIRAAEMANAKHFIETMEKKYEADAGEKGSLLAAGQKQRIAVARALVRHPRVLILDEASSSLDVDTEFKVHEALSRIPGLTVLVIAHRLKTVEKADWIIVLDKGQVVEEGVHRELLKKEGLYHRLVQKCFSENGTNGQD
ncbi:antigen peptide transporter 2-like isoform X1 [Ambystoma mexicanum]|uniref:antigen peptide transporter 2-like isoform X1 n=1 Tax=Ambystoma mexicanum TaxID=8296 RepID=UPI0037E7C444